MNNTPQQVTQRYISNLLHYGRNKEFDIATIRRNANYEGDDHVGFYFTVSVIKSAHIVDSSSHQASGPTIAAAIRRALEKHGVTFR